jgi:putative alpha-1,2-mannosidase
MSEHEINRSLHEWQQRLSDMAVEMENVAEDNCFYRLLYVMDLVKNAVAKIDEVRP